MRLVVKMIQHSETPKVEVIYTRGMILVEMSTFRKQKRIFALPDCRHVITARGTILYGKHRPISNLTTNTCRERLHTDGDRNKGLFNQNKPYTHPCCRYCIAMPRLLVLPPSSWPAHTSSPRPLMVAMDSLVATATACRNATCWERRWESRSC
jgi:hypothetical protein